jgi:putative PIN family toxin of toxin-antitoxin system
VRLVLDTNVLIAAFIARGLCNELLKHCRAKHQVVSSAYILDEYEGKLTGKFKIPRETVRAARAALESFVECVEPAAVGHTGIRDPDDEPVLGTAIAGSCLLLVTGDKDLRALEEYAGIRIVSPTEFWRADSGRPWGA